MTLHCDGTTKFGDKYVSYQISFEDSGYSIGLADMQAGTALQILDIFKGIQQEVERVRHIATGSNNVGAQILGTVKNTMSDRHIVQKASTTYSKPIERKHFLPLLQTGMN